MIRNGVQYEVGIGGWEHECLNGSLYGADTEYSLMKLRYYSRFFDVVEVRPTFWDGDVSPGDARQWMEAVEGNRRFKFIVKLHKSFARSIESSPELATRVRGVLQELQKNDRLGAALLQLPYSFTNTAANRFHLEKIGEQFRGFPLHVEFRNGSWDSPGLITFLKESGLQSVNADLPRIKQYMPFVTGVSGDTGYFRFHGRNEKGWLHNELDVRYDYLYNKKEMRELARRVEIMAEKVNRIMIIFNNTTNGKAVANALQMLSQLVDGKEITIPGAAAQAFPALLTDMKAAIEDGLFTQERAYRRVG